MCLFAKQSATYKGQLLPAAPRTDPYGPNSGIRLLPRVSDAEALLRPWMKDFRLREPVISDLLDPLPGDPTSLAASRKRAAPEVNHVMAECSDRCRVGRHGVIGEIASDNLRQPAPLLGDRLVHPPSHFLLDLLELAHAAWCRRRRRGFNRLTPQTLRAVNDLVVQAAVALGLEDGAKLRVDTTVVETDIHHPPRPRWRAGDQCREYLFDLQAPYRSDQARQGENAGGFGHKVFLAESAKGLITQYEVLKGNPCDEVHVAPSLKRHRRAFGRAPQAL
jgi:hypothetical protein